MYFSPRATSTLLFGISLLLITSSAFAQYGARIEGSVMDQGGAVVSGAKVTAANQATGVSRSTTSNGAGVYSVPGLPPGLYTVTVEAASFPKWEQANVEVGAEVARGVNVVLKSGSEKQTVEVTAGAEVLQTENANIGNTISSQQVVDLPEFGRDPYELVRTTPGVFADASRQGNGNAQGVPQQVGPGGSNNQIFQTENQVQAIANGQRVSANNFMLDGVSVNSLDWGGAAVITPNIESIQEIVVASESYSAQDGRNSGAQVKVSRKLIRTIDLNRLMPGDTFDGVQDKYENDGSNGLPCGPTNPTCLAPHPTGNARFNRIFMPLPDVNASYDAAVFHVTRKFHQGFQLDATYTWSHAIDTASYEIGYQQTDPYNQLIDRGNSDFDVRSNFVLAAVWEVPFYKGKRNLAGYTLGGWSLSGIVSKHSGFPYSGLIGSCNTNADRNGDGYCPDLPFAYNGGVIQSPSKQQWINGVFPNPTASFDTTTLGPGCRCRNIFTGPGYTSVDLALGKEFALPKTRVLGEAANLEFRANMFNAFNILNLTPLIPATASTDIINTTSFGRPSDGLAGRVIELQARLSF